VPTASARWLAETMAIVRVVNAGASRDGKGQIAGIRNVLVIAPAMECVPRPLPTFLGSALATLVGEGPHVRGLQCTRL